MHNCITKIICSLMILGLGHVHAQSIGSETKVPSSLESRIAKISSSTAVGDMERLEKYLADALDNGMTLNEIKEVIVQVYPYAGFPRSLNALTKLREITDHRNTKGISDPLGKEPSIVEFPAGRFEYGKKVQDQLKGTAEIGAAQKFFPYIDVLIKEHVFADLFSRDNLSAAQREIVTISTLASMEGLESQLNQHLKIGRNIGMSKGFLSSVLSEISGITGPKITAKSMLLLNTVFQK